jgi:nitrite reductase/ring-hydroxylating ferredoxin subunit
MESRGRHVVCRVDQLPPGERMIVEVGRKSIGVFNIKGEYFALSNRCPHRGAPLCLGKVTDAVVGSERGEYSVVREGEILRCPWHAWEFDILTGRSWFNPHKVRTRGYKVSIEPADEALPDYVESLTVEVEDRYVVLYTRGRPDE